MEIKNNLKIGKILILLTLTFLVFSIVSAACDFSGVNASEHVIIPNHKVKHCDNDTLTVTVVNITGCERARMEVQDTSGNVICGPVKSEDTFAICQKQLPNITQNTVDELNYTLVIKFKQPPAILAAETGPEIAGNVIEKNITLIPRPEFEKCYDMFGNVLFEGGCKNVCLDIPAEKRWKNTTSISLPMHFNFGTFSIIPRSIPPNQPLTCSNPVYGLAREDIGSSLKCCGIVPDCSCTTCEKDENLTLTWINGSTIARTDVYSELGSEPNWTGIYQFGNLTNPGTATYDSANYTPPNDLNYPDVILNGINTTEAEEFIVRNATGQVNNTTSAGCIESQRCTYTTHNITRYSYTWSFEYDLLSTIYSPDDYIPMFVGYDQEPPNRNIVTDPEGPSAEDLIGKCEDDNICYTELPFCGDGVCDVKAFEQCWNCPEDCYTDPLPKPGFEGNCSADIPPRHPGTDWWLDANQFGGCSRCPKNQNPEDTIDIRGCVKQYKLEGQECSCNIGECGWGNNQSVAGGKTTRLSCIFTDIDGKTAPEGRCCHADERWDPDYEATYNTEVDGIAGYDGGACVRPRELDARDLEIEVITPTDSRAPPVCCGGTRDDRTASWLDTIFSVINRGSTSEKFRAVIDFGDEAPGPTLLDSATLSFPPLGYHDVSNEITLTSGGSEKGDPVDKAGGGPGGEEDKQGPTGRWIACAMANYDCAPGMQQIPNSSGVIIPGDSPFIDISIDTDDLYENYNEHTYPSVLQISNLSCDTKIAGRWCSDQTGSESKGDILIEGPDSFTSGMSICGGYGIPENFNFIGLPTDVGDGYWAVDAPTTVLFEATWRATFAATYASTLPIATKATGLIALNICANIVTVAACGPALAAIPVVSHAWATASGVAAAIIAENAAGMPPFACTGGTFGIYPQDTKCFTAGISPLGCWTDCSLNACSSYRPK